MNQNVSTSTEQWPAGPPCSHCGGPTLAPRPGTDEEGFYCEACGTAWSTTRKEASCAAPSM